MRIAVISDIHGNHEALTEVLADIKLGRIDRIISLGDNVGYGPDPEAVVQCIMEQKIPSVLGNHELAILEPDLLAWFNPHAKKSLYKTEKMLSSASLEYIQHLKKSLVVNGCRFVHGFPPDSPTTYLFQVDRPTMEQTFDITEEPICFTGHTHRPEIIVFQSGRVLRQPFHQGIFQVDPASNYIVNVGSVGQPRDGNDAAKYVIWDTEDLTLELRYVKYPIVMTTQKIIARGFPRPHAERLWGAWKK
ncbi:MAG: metallophosphoesterase [Deltaproteobacteria bacterium]|nr:MAG: metallophosphoesterase [Deltaproteobacteria bacterium]